MPLSREVSGTDFYILWFAFVPFGFYNSGGLAPFAGPMPACMLELLTAKSAGKIRGEHGENRMGGSLSGLGISSALSAVKSFLAVTLYFPGVISVPKEYSLSGPKRFFSA